MSQTVRQAGHAIFQHIMLVIGISMLWSLFVVPALVILPVPAALLFVLLTLMPATAAACAVFHRVLAGGEHYRPGMFSRTFFHYYLRTFILGLVTALALVIIASQWWVYATLNHSYAVFLLAVFQTYLCLAFLATQVYALPVLVVNDCSIMQAVNRSMKCFMCRMGYTIALFIQLLCIIVLLAVTVIGFFLLFIGIYAIFILTASEHIAGAEKMGNKRMSAAKQQDHKGAIDQP